MLQINSHYESKIKQWDKYSAIRSRPRRFIGDEENIQYVFPPARQPIIVHHKLKNISKEQKQFILAQSLYKYLNDIANIEKDIINLAALKINKNQYFVKFPFAFQLDALSIIIDESYHAYVALDFLKQTEEFLNIPSLPLPKETELSNTIYEISQSFANEIFENFYLIAVAIAEHALTHDLIAIAKSKEVCKTFYYVMHDHVLDENRHAKFFEAILELFWKALPSEQKEIIGRQLPKLINNYQAPYLQAQFDRSILEAIQIDKNDIEEIIADTHCGWVENKLNNQNIIAKQMVALLERTNVFTHPIVSQEFQKYGWLINTEVLKS